MAVEAQTGGCSGDEPNSRLEASLVEESMVFITRNV